MKSWAQGLPGHSNRSACSSKVMIYDVWWDIYQAQSPAGVLLLWLNTHTMSLCRAHLPSISPTPCCRGPRRPLPHSPGYEPPFWELLVHSILQIAEAGLAVEKNGCEGRKSKKGWLFLDQCFHFTPICEHLKTKEKKRQKNISAISSFSYSSTQESEIKLPSD